MSGPIPWEFAAILIAFAGGVLAIWWRIERRIEKAEATAAKASEIRAQETAALARELAAYKLSAAQDFASVMDMKDVEQRLGAGRAEAAMVAPMVEDACAPDARRLAARTRPVYGRGSIRSRGRGRLLVFTDRLAGGGRRFVGSMSGAHPWRPDRLPPPPPER